MTRAEQAGTATSTPPGAPVVESPDLETLTGVRSGKRSYYRAYVRSDERTKRAVRAMDSISQAVVRTVEGPRGLLEEVVRAAGEHLLADWTLLALADGQLPSARPRALVADRHARIVTDDTRLPALVRRELSAIRAGHELGGPDSTADPDDPADPDDARWVRVPMVLEGRPIGTLVGLHGLSDDPEPSDLYVLRILANQAAVSLHTSEQYQAGLALHRRAQRLYDEAQSYARSLDTRTDELRQVERRLVVAHQRELIDTERHRIARELHDSVTQYVLSAGMAVELARGDAEALGASASSIQERLGTAKDLSQQAVDQLRRAIYALHQPHGDTVVTLPELLHEVAAHHRPQLEVQVRIEGDVQALPADADHEIARAVGEALFNAASHADARRVLVRLRYRPDLVRAAVSDDGHGDPSALRKLLVLERGNHDGRHRGLANIESRITELGGTVAFRRSRMGGVRVELRVPLPLDQPTHPGMIHNLVCGTDTDEQEPPPWPR